jgi:outer membrane protein assembly factor BamA
LRILVGCQRAVEPRAPIVTACAANRIGHVTVEGAPPSSVASLLVLEGTLDDHLRLQRISQVAAEGLRARGYLQADITITREPSCGVDLIAQVTLGPKFKIGTIEFETDDAFPAATRLALIEDALGTVNTVGGLYVEDRLKRALRELRRRYADAGWLDAKIFTPRARYTEDGTVTVSIPIQAGPRFKIGSVRAVGGGKANRAVVAALGLREGEYYDKLLVRAGIERARKQLDRFIQVRVEIAADRTEIDVEAIVEGR